MTIQIQARNKGEEKRSSLRTKPEYTRKQSAAILKKREKKRTNRSMGSCKKENSRQGKEMINAAIENDFLDSDSHARKGGRALG